MIKIFDNVFDYNDNMYFYTELLLKRKYTYGEVDAPEYPPTGLVYVFDNNDNNILNILHEKCVEYFSHLSNLPLQRSYVNLFLPNEQPFFHSDGNVYTCLFYFTPTQNIDEGGETQFLVEEELFCVRSKPSRLIIFDGKLYHRATSYRNNPRITVALKYSKHL